MSQEGKAIVTAAFRSTQSTLLTLLNYVKNFRQTVPTAYIVISIIFALINISLSMTRDDILFSDTPFITLAPLLCSFIPFFPRSASIAYSACWLALLIAPAAANFVGPFLAGMLIDHAGRAPADMLAFRVCFAVMAALPLVCWLLARGADEPPLAPPLAGATPTRAWDLLREPMFRRLLFVNWLQSSSWDVHAFVLPVLGHDRGISASVIGSILGAFAVAAAVIRVVLPVIASRASERSVILSSTIVTALVFAVYPLLEAAWAMGVCSVILGFALGAVQPMVMSMLHQITPHTRHGEALGLRLMTINASSVAMPMLFGSLGALIGIAGVFWVVGGVLALGARATWGLKV